MRFTRSIKASLNLSINAIVILILAFAMLGLGLAFMSGIFEQFTGKAEAALSVDQLIITPTSDNVMVVQPSDTDKRARNEENILIGYLNAFGEDATCTLTVLDVSGGTYTMIPLYNDLPKQINADEIGLWQIVLQSNDPKDGNDNAVTGSFLLSATILCNDFDNTILLGSASRDISVKITS